MRIQSEIEKEEGEAAVMELCWRRTVADPSDDFRSSSSRCRNRRTGKRQGTGNSSFSLRDLRITVECWLGGGRKWRFTSVLILIAVFFSCKINWKAKCYADLNLFCCLFYCMHQSFAILLLENVSQTFITCSLPHLTIHLDTSRQKLCDLFLVLLQLCYYQEIMLYDVEVDEQQTNPNLRLVRTIFIFKGIHRSFH
ncbi:unnamed protein product [Lactuca virosa]|uniref:Uncharacterized protein n=1 Tax=Lactuca virosa TaxID=75947 RepID=A0AAU9P600_9ASTR|nr:unnamed protein product [Lactuca virosa]